MTIYLLEILPLIEVASVREAGERPDDGDLRSDPKLPAARGISSGQQAFLSTLVHVDSWHAHPRYLSV